MEEKRGERKSEEERREGRRNRQAKEEEREGRRNRGKKEEREGGTSSKHLTGKVNASHEPK